MLFDRHQKIVKDIYLRNNNNGLGSAKDEYYKKANISRVTLIGKCGVVQYYIYYKSFYYKYSDQYIWKIKFMI